jgi:hypothetical protein
MSVMLAGNVDLYSLVNADPPKQVTTHEDFLSQSVDIFGLFQKEKDASSESLKPKAGRSKVKVETPENIARPIIEPKTNAGDEAATETAKKAPAFRRTLDVDIDDLGLDAETSKAVRVYKKAIEDAKAFGLTIGGKEIRLKGIPVYKSEPKSKTFLESVTKDSLRGFASGMRLPKAPYDDAGNLKRDTSSKSIASGWRTAEFYEPDGMLGFKKNNQSVSLKDVTLMHKAGYPPFFVESKYEDTQWPPLKVNPNAPEHNPKFIKAPADGSARAEPKPRVPKAARSPISTGVSPRAIDLDTASKTPAVTRAIDVADDTTVVNNDLIDFDDFGRSMYPSESPAAPAAAPVSAPISSPPPPPVTVSTPARRQQVEDDKVLTYDPTYAGPHTEVLNKAIVKVLESVQTSKAMTVKDILELAMESTDDGNLQLLLETMIDRLDGAGPKDYMKRLGRAIKGFFHLQFS